MWVVGEKEKSMYLLVLDADTIKQIFMKEKVRKKFLKGQENLSKQNSTVEISSK